MKHKYILVISAFVCGVGFAEPAAMEEIKEAIPAEKLTGQIKDLTLGMYGVDFQHLNAEWNISPTFDKITGNAKFEGAKSPNPAHYNFDIKNAQASIDASKLPDSPLWVGKLSLSAGDISTTIVSLKGLMLNLSSSKDGEMLNFMAQLKFENLESEGSSMGALDVSITANKINPKMFDRFGGSFGGAKEVQAPVEPAPEAAPEPAPGN